MAIVALLNGDHNLSRHYSTFSQNLILERFSRLHPLAVESRLKLLGRLQMVSTSRRVIENDLLIPSHSQLAELNEFLDINPSTKSLPQKPHIEHLMGSWEDR